MMVDDQGRCEWVNVSSATDLPVQSQTKGLRTVVVVLEKNCCGYVAQDLYKLDVLDYFTHPAVSEQ